MIRTRKGLRVTLGLLATTVGVLALASGIASADTVRIKAAGSSGNWTWQPDVRHSTPGDRVVWTNPTRRTHTVTAYGSGWSKNTTLRPGDRTAKTFSAKGSYYYRCTKHSHLADNGDCHGMCGYVHVM